MDFRTLYNADCQRNTGGGVKRFLYFLRKYQTTNSKLLKFFYKLLAKPFMMRRCLEIPMGLEAGGGLYIGHAYCITINRKAKLGWNVNIHKGLTIGRENRGKREGVPTIGNNVWIGINATIVGKIVIGNDVLIAPNSYVNCDVPDHSIVYGNPCIIKHRDNATEGYINQKVNIPSN